MQIGQKKTAGQKMKKDRKPNISQIQKTGEHCIYAKRCGGCDYQGILYSQQLSKKQSYMRKLMEPFGKINPIIGMDDPYHYRHKVQAAFSCNKRGHIVAGVYEKHSHDIVDVEQCQIEDAQADAIIREIKNMMRSFRIRAYDEDTGYGLLRHVLVRKGYHSGQIMVVLVLVSPILPSKNNFVKALRKKFPEISTVVINVNDRKTSMVLGERNITVYGKGFIAKRNHIHNVTFYNEDAGQFMVEMAEKGEHADVVIMDPPRTGSDEAFLSSVVRLAPNKVVYVSCGPETLVRDLKYLTKHGYRMKECTPFDLFPFTKHVETVVLLSQLRQKPDDYIDVDIDVAELEGTSAETKATYEKIKKYVAEHNDGMKVSNLYIAQVKRKCGIELAENFNLPKSEDARQPRCPKEKEEAIVEALKAFQMI